MFRFIYIFLSLFISFFSGLKAENLFLKDNLQRAQPGDYIVIFANKTITLMHVYDKKNQILVVEEVSAPGSRLPKKVNWKTWIQNEAPENTSWVMYEIDLNTGKMLRYYSFTKKGWFEIAEADNFLSKLLNLRLSKIPEKERKKVGLKILAESEEARIWQPPLIVDGQTIRGVKFDAWRTRWPQDNSDLAGKMIELYLPQDNQAYPSYFPYWLQVYGTIGKARVRIVDSGTDLRSPKPAVMNQ